MPVLQNSNTYSTKSGKKDLNGKSEKKTNSDPAMEITDHNHALIPSSSLSLMDCSPSSSNNISNLITPKKNIAKRHLNQHKSQSTNKPKSKCPHVVLIGEILEENFEIEKQVAYQKKKTQSKHHVKHIKSTKVNGHVLEHDEESIDNRIHNETDSGINDVDSNGKLSDDITMNDDMESSSEQVNELKCDECNKTHNLWLCLRDNCMHVGCGQDDHSNKHGNLHAYKTFHPLSMNLKTRNVWCELCENRIDLENNNPPLKSYAECDEALNNSACETAVDDLDLLSYLEQDCTTKYKSNDSEHDSQNDLNYGLYGLQNLGNTCYLNAAIQALSNCYAFTSFFLECSHYIQNRVKANEIRALNSIALNYMKLVMQLWSVNNNGSDSITPTDFVHTIKFNNPMFRGFNQHDSQEFLIYLLDQLHEELKRPTIQLESNELDNEDDDEVDNHSKCSKSLTESTEKEEMLSSDESVDSYETCGTDAESRDSLHYSDADETLVKLKESDKQHKEFYNKKPIYSSIISELFEGKIINQVKCLECNNLSKTTEPFQHLSLPIPSKEFVQASQDKLSNAHYKSLDDSSDATTYPNSSNNNGWFNWMFGFMKGYFWSDTIQLGDCLSAFFSDDDLKDDNMYNCEKCKKLTNGVKYSKILKLPEILIIQLKRFRHDLSFYSSKINSYIAFPLDNLNMQPFVHKDCKNEITQYDLCSIIRHHGGAGGGHYTSYARNYLNEEWYEYDDSYCRQVESLAVQNAQAYVLFYKKKNIITDTVKNEMRDSFMKKAMGNGLKNEISLLGPYYISKEWLHKLKYFGEPGPIDNSDFLCIHNKVQPNVWKIIENIAITSSYDTWNYLVSIFGFKSLDNIKKFDHDASDHGVCNYFYPCEQCQIDDEQMKQRQLNEKNEFIRLREKYNKQCLQSNSQSVRLYAISSSWFKQWESFVQFNGCPSVHQVPGPINNLSISQASKTNPKEYHLNKSGNFYKLNEEMWTYLYDIYGGGPILPISSSNIKLKQQIENCSKI